MGGFARISIENPMVNFQVPLRLRLSRVTLYLHVRGETGKRALELSQRGASSKEKRYIELRADMTQKPE